MFIWGRADEAVGTADASIVRGIARSCSLTSTWPCGLLCRPGSGPMSHRTEGSTTTSAKSAERSFVHLEIDKEGALAKVIAELKRADAAMTRARRTARVPPDHRQGRVQQTPDRGVRVLTGRSSSWNPLE